MTWKHWALLIGGVVVLLWLVGCSRNDGMGDTWKGVRCVETGRC